jgi:hypothetical protein
VTDTPPQPSKVAKVGVKAKPEGPSELQVAVVFAEDHWLPMSDVQAEEIRTYLVSRIRGVPKGNFVGKFNQSGLSGGTFKVSCYDQDSLQWLIEAVSELVVAGKSVAIVCQDSLKLQAASVFIPGPPEEYKVVFDTLERQNPGLCTDKWRKYSVIHKSEPRGQVIVFGLDGPSAEQIQVSRGQLFFELSRVVVRLRGKAGGSAAESSQQ